MYPRIYKHLTLDYLPSMNICRHKRNFFCSKKNDFLHAHNTFSCSLFIAHIPQYNMHIPIYDSNIFLHLIERRKREKLLKKSSSVKPKMKEKP